MKKKLISLTISLIILLAGVTVGRLSLLHNHHAMAQNSSEMKMDMDMDMDMEELFEAEDPNNPPYISDLTIQADSMEGWNLFFEYENFTFTPQNASREHISDEGHAHLHINGEKIARLYTNAYHIKSLPQGDHVISVFLNTNDHKEYAVSGAGTGMEIVLSVQ